jgi:predicted ATPase
MVAPLRSELTHQRKLTEPTQLIGREQEVVRACDYLQADTRLLTLVGVGGVGKTRLGQQIVANLQDGFADGACFVSLAPINDHELVIPTIARALGIKEVGDLPFLDLLVSFLLDKHLLLFLDNFEQVTLAAPKLSELLASCSHLKILVTSRAVLHIRDEQESHVLPLALPDLKQLPEWKNLHQYAAVELFLQFASAKKPGFTLTSTNAHSIAEICAFLEGIPLSLELAAPYIKVLTPQALLRRLTMYNRLEVLTHGPQDAPLRQQDLRSTLMWSYDLLEASEQQLLRQLSVFVSGCTLEDLEGICAMIDDGARYVLGRVTSLIDKSLLQQNGQDEDTRLVMLETIREYGLELLRASGEEAATRHAHALHYLELAEKASTKLRSSGHYLSRWWIIQLPLLSA